MSCEVKDGAWAGAIPSAGYGALASSVTNAQVDYVRVYSAVVPSPPFADFNFDCQVDGADFLIWQRNSGVLTGARRVNGNANADVDGDVDIDDLFVWKQQYGSEAICAVVVPESPSYTLVATALVRVFR